MSTLKIAIIDDHASFGESLSFRLLMDERVKECKHYYGLDDFFKVRFSITFDCILLDVNLKTMTSGIDAIPRLKSLNPTPHVFILSAEIKQYKINQAQKLGQTGYFDKASSPLDILRQVHKVLEEKTGFIGPAARDLQNPLIVLSRAELDVAKRIKNHLSTTQIADELFRSPNTIATHRKHIYRKLDINSNTQLVELIERFGLPE